MSNWVSHKNIRFQPWVGKTYGRNSLFKVPVLIVGESNYGTSEGKKKDAVSVSNWVMKHVAKEENFRFFSNIQRCFVKESASIDSRREFWSSVAHCEYIQNYMSESDKPFTKAMITRARPVFDSIVSKLKPKCILFASKRLYYAVESNFPKPKPSIKIRRDACYIGSAVATWILHPTWRGFRKSRPTVRRLLKSVGGKCHV